MTVCDVDVPERSSPGVKPLAVADHESVPVVSVGPVVPELGGVGSVLPPTCVSAYAFCVKSVEPTGGAPRTTTSVVFDGSFASKTPALLFQSGPPCPTCHVGPTDPLALVSAPKTPGKCSSRFPLVETKFGGAAKTRDCA